VGLPTGPAVPNLVGYARELATRKLAAMGLLSDVSSVIVEQASQEGRIIRQVPGAGTTAAPGTVVRLFVGKLGGA
jgi:beta-lactam-binding protein with PASTA domain